MVYMITRQVTFAQFSFFLKIGFIMHEKSSKQTMGSDVGGKYLQNHSSYHDPVKQNSVNEICKEFLLQHQEKMK